MDWWSSFCARKVRRQPLLPLLPLLPWLFRVGRSSGQSWSQSCSQSCSQSSGRYRPPAPRIEAQRGSAQQQPPLDGGDVYGTCCIAGHLLVDDGATALGTRLWHCRRPGCGAGRFAALRQAMPR
jgi:hypothetical protein